MLVCVFVRLHSHVVKLVFMPVAIISRLRCPLDAAQTLASHTLQCEYMRMYTVPSHTHTHTRMHVHILV